jgi:CRISPR-associated protein Cas8a1/Csx13
VATELNELTWRLSDPGMDLLERAGLAALYMCLEAARELEYDLSPLCLEASDLTPSSVTVRWEGAGKAAFTKLLEWAWQVREGVLFLPAVHREQERENLHTRLPMHNGIFRTFLQHTNVQPKGEPITRIVALAEGEEVAVTYQPPIIREPKPRKRKETSPKTGASKKAAPTKAAPKKLLKPCKDLDSLFDRVGNLQSEPVSLPGWTMPGVAPRFKTEQSWEGPARQALLLLLAPATVLFQRLQGKGSNWVLVVPDIRDLADFSDTRRRMNLNADFVDVASLGDAALQFLAEYATRSVRRQACAGCRVVAMGKVTYYKAQSIRKGVLDVPFTLASVKRYQHLHRALPNAYVAYKSDPDADEEDEEAGDASGPRASGFIKLPSARGRIADNLVLGRAWYADLFAPLIWDLQSLERQRKSRPGTSLERLWFTNVRYQKDKLMKLITEDDMWDSEAEKVFVHALWQTIESLYAQEAAAAAERGGSRTIEERFDDLNEDIRRKLMQAKTRALLRGALTELIANAGRPPVVREHPAAIWRMVDHPDNWKKARDLALLALASYQSREKRGATTPAARTKGE